MTKPADLIAYLFARQPHPLSGTLLGWMESSARFTAFVETYRDKIRKKSRLPQERESLLDVRSELEIAFCLLNDRRLALAYEPYLHAGRRGPDFAVTYRTNLIFNIEVARIRGEENGAGELNLARKQERILRILLDKLGQMQPGMPNLLVIHSGDELAHAIDLAGLMHRLKLKVEGKDPAFYASTRYAGPAAFYKDFLLLSGILLWAVEPQVWVNRQARPALDEKVVRLVGSLSSGAWAPTGKTGRE